MRGKFARSTVRKIRNIFFSLNALLKKNTLKLHVRTEPVTDRVDSSVIMCLVYMADFSVQKPNIYCCLRFSRGRFGLYAELQTQILGQRVWVGPRISVGNGGSRFITVGSFPPPPPPLSRSPAVCLKGVNTLPGSTLPVQYS